MTENAIENCSRARGSGLNPRSETARGSDSAASAVAFRCTCTELPADAPLYREGSRAVQSLENSDHE